MTINSRPILFLAPILVVLWAGSPLTSSGTQLDVGEQSSANDADGPTAMLAQRSRADELSLLKISELLQRASGAGVDSRRIEEAIDADDVKASLLGLLLSGEQQPQMPKTDSEAAQSETLSPYADNDNSVDERRRHLKSCGPGKLLLPPGVCEEESPDSEPSGAVTTGSRFSYMESVPVYSKHLTKPMKKSLLPFLREYILEREMEWMASELALSKMDQSFHVASYSFLESGRTKKERKQLDSLRAFIKEMMLEYLKRWERTAIQDPKMGKTWKQYIDAATWDSLPHGALIESWSNVHRRRNGTGYTPCDAPTTASSSC